jgi:hypothetical protein
MSGPYSNDGPLVTEPAETAWGVVRLTLLRRGCAWTDDDGFACLGAIRASCNAAHAAGRAEGKECQRRLDEDSAAALRTTGTPVPKPAADTNPAAKEASHG